VPHNIANHYVVDLDNCLRCWRCFDACPTKAIDFKFDERENFHVLVVSPDQELTQSLPEWLKKENFPLHFSASGEDGLARITGGQDVQLEGHEVP